MAQAGQSAICEVCHSWGINFEDKVSKFHDFFWVPLGALLWPRTTMRTVLQWMLVLNIVRGCAHWQGTGHLRHEGTPSDASGYFAWLCLKLPNKEAEGHSSTGEKEARNRIPPVWGIIGDGYFGERLPGKRSPMSWAWSNLENSWRYYCGSKSLRPLNLDTGW